MLSNAMRAAINRFDAAAHEHAFRGTHSGSPRYEDVLREYHDAKRNLEDTIARALKVQYKHGEDDGYSRSQVRPGFGDMGG